MGKPPKHETIKTLVVCWEFGPVSTQPPKLWLFAGSGATYVRNHQNIGSLQDPRSPKHESVKTLVARDGQAP